MAASITIRRSSRRSRGSSAGWWRSSDKPEQGYRITILNAPAVNAFALQGGYLYVTRGLLALANDSSEIAAVLGHEIGHITANHAIQRENKARNALIVSRVATDVLDDSSGKLALASTQRTLASFSRQQELEADAIGIRTIGKAGYDPFAAARFLQAMSRFATYRSTLCRHRQAARLPLDPPVDAGTGRLRHPRGTRVRRARDRRSRP